MRELLAKALKMGLTVSFSEENGFSIIRLSRNGQVVSNCSLGAGDFNSTVEESLSSLLLDAERHSL